MKCFNHETECLFTAPTDINTAYQLSAQINFKVSDSGHSLLVAIFLSVVTLAYIFRQHFKKKLYGKCIFSNLSLCVFVLSKPYRPVHDVLSPVFHTRSLFCPVHS